MLAVFTIKHMQVILRTFPFFVSNVFVITNLSVHLIKFCTILFHFTLFHNIVFFTFILASLGSLINKSLLYLKTKCGPRKGYIHTVQFYSSVLIGSYFFT